MGTRCRLPTKILITNDDGPPGEHSPFIVSMVRALRSRQIADSEPGARPEMFVCVPATQQSWKSKSQDPYRKDGVVDVFVPEDRPFGEDIETVYVDGTPSAAAQIAIHHLCPFEPDITISGPNLGDNVGRSYNLSSGTIGAAMEVACTGRRAIAVSYAVPEIDPGCEVSHFCPSAVQDASAAAVDVIAALCGSWGEHAAAARRSSDGCQGAGALDIFNVNVPLGCGPRPAVYETVALRDAYTSLYTCEEYRKDGGASFKFKSPERPGHGERAPEGTDAWALDMKAVSVTPLSAAFQAVRLDAQYE
jgi:tubulin--tyrosine ligase